MRKTIGILVLLLAARVSAQTPTPATFNPLPQQNGSFFSALTTFLYGEDADRFNAGFNSFQIQGCVHGTAAGMTGTFSVACNAIVHGHYTVEPASSLNYTGIASANDVCWLAVHDDTTTAVSGWTRVTGTHYIVKCTGSSATIPALGTTHAMVTASVTISSSAITAVTFEYAQRPWERIFKLDGEITDSRTGQWWRRSTDDLMFYATSPTTLKSIPNGDTAGCATCGDSATAFFSTGTCENARGCTGQNSSTWTGIVKVGPTPGTWTHEDQVQPEEGAFGEDVSACKASGGIPHWTTSSVFNCSFGAFRKDATAFEMTVDATQCTRVTSVSLVSGVNLNVITCADNSAGRIFYSTVLPSSYQNGAAVVFRLLGTNAGSTAGDTGFDITCMCLNTASGGTTMTAANFATAEDLDFTWSGTAGQTQHKTATVTCGGSCVSNNMLVIKLSVDATATTHASPTDIKYTNLFLQAAEDGL